MCPLMKRILKIFLKVTGITAGVLLLLLVVAQIVLSPKVCTKLVLKYYPEFLDGELSLSSASVSLFRHFPAITLDIGDMVVTYPSDRFAGSDSTGVQNWMTSAGKFKPVSQADSTVVPMDTLASFGRFSVSLNVIPLIWGSVNIKDVELSRPRAFIHFYADSTSNLSVIKPLAKTNSTEDQDDSAADADSLSASVDLPEIAFRRLHLGDDARIFYTDKRDTLLTFLALKSLEFDGRLRLDRMENARFHLDVDSLLLAGNAGRDTLLFALDHLKLKDRKGNAWISAGATAYYATHTFGRLKIPLSVDGNMHLDMENSNLRSATLNDFRISAATLDACLQLRADFGEKLFLDGSISVPDLDLQKTLDGFAVNFYPDAGHISTDAHISAGLSVNGCFDPESSSLPSFKASVDMNPCHLNHSDIGLPVNLEFHAGAGAEQGGPVSVDVPSLVLNAEGISLDLSGNCEDVLGDTRCANVDGRLRASLGTLDHYLSEQLEMNISGEVTADVKGRLYLSPDALYNQDGSDLKVDLLCKGVRARSFDDSLNVDMNRLSFNTALMKDGFSGGRKGMKKSLGASLDIDSISFFYRDNVNFNGRNIRVFAQSSESKVEMPDGSLVNPLMARLNISNLFFEGRDSLSIRLRNSSNAIRVSPSAGRWSVPVISISSLNERVRAKMGPRRFFLKGLELRASAQKSERRLGRDLRLAHYMDSVYAVHPTWSKDSIRTYMHRKARMRQVPDWLSEQDFRKADISVDLGEAFKQYFTDWDLKGSVGMDRAGIVMPEYPLRTSITALRGSFDNNNVNLDTLRVISGDSNFSLGVNMSNLRRFISGSGTARLRMKVDTDSLAVGQVMNALEVGRQNMGRNLSYLEKADDAAFEDLVVTDDISDTLMVDASPLFVLPGNIDANLAVRGKGITYSALWIKRLDVDLLLKRRCLQLIDGEAETNVGDLHLDAFYSTRTKNDVLAGINLDISNLEAGKAIELMPSIDTLMPLLRTFDGNMHCTIAATARLDTAMSVVVPSINGVVRLSGKDLHFNNDPQIAKYGRMLLFRNPRRATVDTLLVEGIIKDNAFELFPFSLAMDRWTVILAGIQNMDNSFNYHASLARTPLLFHWGADLSGTDFSHTKFKLGVAKYRSSKIPSFSDKIDDTRDALVFSIRNVFSRGAKQAMDDNENKQKELARERVKRNYAKSAALEEKTELSEEEIRRLEEMQYRDSRYSIDAVYLDRIAPALDSLRIY